MPSPLLLVVVGALAVLVGVFLGYLAGKSSARATAAAESGTEARLLREQLAALATEKSSAQSEARRLQEAVTQLTADLSAQTANVEAEQKKYAQMTADIERLFGDIASRALRNNTQSFLDLAKQELGAQNQAAKQTLEARETAIKNLIDPLGQTLKSLDTKTQEMEKARAGAYGELRTLVDSLGKSIPEELNSLRNETSQLVAALRAPKTRGNWGELQLKRCVEYAGMVQYCSFSEQVTAHDDDKILRPDMTIQMPNGREIVVDAKTPLDAFLDAAGSSDPATQKLRFEAHAQRVRAHLKDLSGKAYWKQFDKAPDFVVCFLPSEALFSAALEADPTLIEFGAQSRVVMATPTTLIALLRAVEFGWQQMEITKNAKAIHEMGRKIYEKLVTAQSHVARLGNALGNSVDYYNKFLGSIEGKGSVFSSGRQLGELVHADAELPESTKLLSDVRPMESAEWSQPLLEEGRETK
ncbi:MAG: DNA recombination protein RmuC [Terracidiphilus sp.]|nr:DNA recombination protein RmuC [Terracidiphilus sp.]